MTNYQLDSFTNIRSLILRESILNALLVDMLDDSPLPVYVGSSLRKLNADESKKINRIIRLRIIIKRPDYAMAKIYVSRERLPCFSIGYSFNDYATITKEANMPWNLKQNHIVYLKEISEKIEKMYSICAVKSDNVFSKAPISFVNYVESSGMSINYWEQGFSKEIKNVSNKINQDEIKEYHALLVSRLNDWQLFNYLLTLLDKDDTLELEKEKVGKITASIIRQKNSVCLTFYSYIDYSQKTIDVPLQKLNPVEWERTKYDINILDLRDIIF